jgi:hypothetical protein
MTALAHGKFEATLGELELDVAHAEQKLGVARANLKRVARAAHAAGMTEREIAKAVKRSGPAVHAWLHAKDPNQQAA